MIHEAMSIRGYSSELSWDSELRAALAAVLLRKSTAREPRATAACAARCTPRSMENHIFYEEIGSGRFSTVFKGRLKRSVEFVAIRRVERSHRAPS